MQAKTAFSFQSFTAQHYTRVDWSRQLLALATARATQEAGRVFSQYMSTPYQDQAIARAHYWCPSTYHRLYRKPLQGIDAQYVDVVPALFADVDYHRTKPYYGEIFLSLLEADLTPTLMVESPHGYHMYWYLREPLAMRWVQQQKRGVWTPHPGAMRGLEWWRDVSFALHRRLIAMEIPADTSGAGTPARLLRMPTSSTVRHWDPDTTWTLDLINRRIEEYKLKKCYVVGLRRKVSLDEGLPEGERNQGCYHLALALAQEYKNNPESGWRALAGWCGRCTPAYPQAEAGAVWKWAVRKVLSGKAIGFRWETGERTREQQGPYARKIVQAKIDEKIASAVATMQAEGIADPWGVRGGVKRIAELAGIPYRTVSAKKKKILEKKYLT